MLEICGCQAVAVTGRHSGPQRLELAGELSWHRIGNQDVPVLADTGGCGEHALDQSFDTIGVIGRSCRPQQSRELGAIRLSCARLHSPHLLLASRVSKISPAWLDCNDTGVSFASQRQILCGAAKACTQEHMACLS